MNSTLIAGQCHCCQTTLVQSLAEWHWHCPTCHYEKALLAPAINSAAHQFVDEDAREKGLGEVRQANFKVLLSQIARFKPQGGTLLDVGSAHGWFLKLAKKAFDTTGIEPDQAIWSQAHAQGLKVRLGYFPDVLSEQERFDVITFNDVLEHIPDIEQALDACRRHLNPDGLLVINLPSSRGVFYRLSKMLSRLGWSSSFERMWQKDFPSPHVHYFNEQNLSLLLNNKQFQIVRTGRLKTLMLSGLAARLSYGSSASSIKNKILYFAIVLALPFLAILPTDIQYVIVRANQN